MSLYNQNNLNVAKIASRLDIQPELAGVLFCKDKTVATDNFRLIEMSTPKDMEVKDYPKIDNKEIVENFEPFIINSSDIKGVKLPKNKMSPVLENLVITKNDTRLVEVMTVDKNISPTTKTFYKVDGKYPDYENSIQVEGEPVAEIVVNGDYLAELCSILARLDRNKRVRIKIFAKQKPIILEAENENQKGKAFLMSITD